MNEVSIRNFRNTFSLSPKPISCKYLTDDYFPTMFGSIFQKTLAQLTLIYQHLWKQQRVLENIGKHKIP